MSSDVRIALFQIRIESTQDNVFRIESDSENFLRIESNSSPFGFESNQNKIYLAKICVKKGTLR